MMMKFWQQPLIGMVYINLTPLISLCVGGGGANTSFASFSSVTKEKQSSDETVMFSSSSSSKGTVKEESQRMWHRRLGHLNSRCMALMNKGMVTGINIIEIFLILVLLALKVNRLVLPFLKSHTYEQLSY